MAIYDINGNVIATGSSVFVSVKDFGATGTGVTSDSSAIQSALDSLKDSGGIIYFPKGTYRLSVAVLFYSNQTLLFENGARLVQGTEINNMMRSYSEDTWTEYNGVHDCMIIGAIFDGGTGTTNNTLLGICHAKNITIKDCTFKNAYGTWHDLEINSSYNVKVLNCDFEGSRKTGANAELIQVDKAAQVNYPWSNVNYDGTSCKYVEIAGCVFHGDIISPAFGSHDGTGTHQFIRIHDNVFDGFTSERGTINIASGQNVDIHDNTFNECTTGIGSSGATYYIHDNRFVDVTTAISGNASVAHNNMINGTFTA